MGGLLNHCFNHTLVYACSATFLGDDHSIAIPWEKESATKLTTAQSKIMR